ERALAPGAPVIWPEAPDNVALDWTDGDAAAVEMACARAAHVERVRLLDTRLAPAALEPRAAIGQWDAVSGRYTLIAGTQGVAVVRRMLAEFVFKVPAPQIRVLTYDVGGGFGMKTQPYAEYAALLYAAPAGRRRSTSSSGCWMARRGRRGSTASSYGGGISSRPRRCPTARRTARSTTAASSRRSWTRRWRSRTGRASRRGAPPPSGRAGCAGSVSPASSRSPAVSSTRRW